MVKAPRVAAHALPGQFVIVRAAEDSERVPFTIADIDPEAGTITLVVQEVGATTARIAGLKAGQGFRDLLGPLGHPSEVEKFGTVALVGGGFGIAAVYMLAKDLRKAGKQNRIHHRGAHQRPAADGGRDAGNFGRADDHDR